MRQNGWCLVSSNKAPWDTQISQNRAKFKCTKIILLSLLFRSNYNSRCVFLIFHDIHQDHGVSSDTEQHTMFSPKFLGRSLKSWQLHQKKVSCCFLFLIFDWLSIFHDSDPWWSDRRWGCGDCLRSQPRQHSPCAVWKEAPLNIWRCITQHYNLPIYIP